jgi:hypothetical protein
LRLASGMVVQQLVEGVGDVFVVEGNGVGIVAQRGCRVAVSESRLCLQQPAVADELRGDSVAEPVQRRPFDTRRDTESGEPV